MEANSAVNGRSLANRVALVTGVSRRKGIGFAIADRLAAFGANLFVHSFVPFDAGQPWGADPEGTRSLVEQLKRHGGRVLHDDKDLSAPEAPEHLISAAKQALGHLDILVANHAYSTMSRLEDLTTFEIDRHLLVNVRATLLLIKYFAAQHDGRPGGRVVLLTSGQHLDPMPDELAYVASKGALHQLTLSLANHLAPRGITVNAVNPGATDTGYASPALYQEVLRQEPMGRWGEPEDAARLIAWLTTDDARWITGQIINSTGGGL
jgi:3-oxoacyl-[acyl-carrier protein] reductase